MTEDRKQETDDRGRMADDRWQMAGDRFWKVEWGLRPVGAIGAYAPEGRRKGEDAQG